MGRRASDHGWPAGGSALGCRIVDLPRITDPRGNLTFIEGGEHVPFDIARVYYLYDVPGGEFAAGMPTASCSSSSSRSSGSFDVVVDDGTDTAASTSTARTTASTCRA